MSFNYFWDWSKIIRSLSASSHGSHDTICTMICHVWLPPPPPGTYNLERSSDYMGNERISIEPNLLAISIKAPTCKLNHFETFRQPSYQVNINKWNQLMKYGVEVSPTWSLYEFLPTKLWDKIKYCFIPLSFRMVW